MAEPQDIDAGLAASLRDDAAAAAPLLELGASCPETITERIDYHGIGHLLAGERAPRFDLPDWLTSHLREAAMGSEYWEATHSRALAPLLAAMQEAVITPVVMKGTALAYSLYRQPGGRVRGDTDLLVAAKDLQGTRAALRACGFVRGEELHGRLFQEVWLFRVNEELSHEVDLHWQVNDSPVLQQVLPLEPALANTRPLDRLAPGVRSLSLAESLIQLALNAEWHATFGYRIGDRKIAGTRRLIWTCDVDLLLRAMDARDWRLLVSRAHDTGVTPALRNAVDDARQQLGTPVAEEWLAELRQSPADGPVMAYLRCDNRIARLKADFAASRGLRAKANFAARMLLPTRQQLRRRYPAATNWPLLALYVRHAVENATKLVRQ